jgi:trimeric autotransporter adhesin
MPGQITNNYAVDPNYRLGYVQIWNLDVQQEIRPTLFMNLDYTGAKGTRLDILEDPNRDLTGIRIPGVQAFNWETSAGDSTAHAGSFRLRKRLQRGVSIGGSYTWLKALNNASSIGGSVAVVAQNPFDLAAERGLSSFDQRHRFTADYLWELPFGHEKRWLTQNGVWRSILGDWQWSGDWTIASGTPFTPVVLGNFADVNRGTNGTLRADITGLPVTLPSPSISEWFNTAAFVAPPAGQYGNARRNSIIGPGTVLFDMAFTKVFPIKDTRVLEFRAQASNIFNTPQLTAIDTTVNSPTFGRVTAVGAMRTFQLTSRFRF